MNGRFQTIALVLLAGLMAQCAWGAGVYLAAAPSDSSKQSTKPAKNPSFRAGKALKDAVNLSGKPSGAQADEVIVQRANCGTAWTGWVDDPNADANPCPKSCKRGERQVLDQHKSGTTARYRARYECYLPQLVVKQPSWALSRLKADGTQRVNCGTAWTKETDDPNADVNPCPSNCERGELQLVNRYVSGDTLKYEMRYRCYVAEAGAKLAGAEPIATKTDRPGTTASLKDVASTSLTVLWKPVTGASGYVVHAAAKGFSYAVESGVQQQPARLLGDMSTSLSGLAPGVEHSVWVTVNYPDGGHGTSNLMTTVMAGAENPAEFRAVFIGSGTVRLEWQPAPGASGYIVEGDNLPSRVLTNTSVVVSNLPMGRHDWTLIAVYPPGVFNDQNPATAALILGSAGTSASGPAAPDPSVASQAGNAVGDAARATGDAVKGAAKSVGKAAGDAGRAVGNAIHDLFK